MFNVHQPGSRGHSGYHPCLQLCHLWDIVLRHDDKETYQSISETTHHWSNVPPSLLSLHTFNTVHPGNRTNMRLLQNSHTKILKCFYIIFSCLILSANILFWKVYKKFNLHGWKANRDISHAETLRNRQSSNTLWHHTLNSTVKDFKTTGTTVHVGPEGGLRGDSF